MNLKVLKNLKEPEKYIDMLKENYNYIQKLSEPDKNIELAKFLLYVDKLKNYFKKYKTYKFFKSNYYEIENFIEKYLSEYKKYMKTSFFALLSITYYNMFCDYYIFKDIEKQNQRLKNLEYKYD